MCKEIPDRLNSKREPVRRKKFLSHNLVDETGRFLRKDVSGEAQDSAGELRINAPDAASAEINGVNDGSGISVQFQRNGSRSRCGEMRHAAELHHLRQGFVGKLHSAVENVGDVQKKNPAGVRKRGGVHCRRGIDRDTAEAAMQTFSPDEAQMLALLEKRLRGDVSDRKEVEKAVAALQRRGFAWNDIKRALETYGNSLPEEE